MIEEIKTTRDGILEIQRLNSKIREFNIQSQKSPPPTLICIHLLQEINHISSYIRQQITDQINVVEYQNFTQFKGIAEALSQFELFPSNGAIAKSIFTKNLVYRNGLPSTKELQTKNLRLKFILNDIKSLSQQKENIIKSATTKDIEAFYYYLQTVKKTLLDKLSFELTNPNDIHEARKLLSQINNEINQAQNIIPWLQQRSQEEYNMASLNISQELSSMSQEHIENLINLLRNQNPPPSVFSLKESLPSLANYEITRLGGANNINWKISDPVNGTSFVLQVAESSPNQHLIAQLQNTSATRYLTQEFDFSTPLDNPFRLVLTEFVEGGDLRTQRKQQFSTPLDNTIILAAADKISELTSICQDLLSNKTMHPDIKLTNFLINSNGKITVADKKALIAVDDKGLVYKHDIVTTQPYAPPEHGKQIHAEAFVCYQLGLALYDYILTPSPPTNNKDPFWSENHPLDFTDAIFKTPEGQRMQHLIERMVDPDYTKRPDLSTVQTILHEIKPSLFVQNATEKIPNIQVEWKRTIKNYYIHDVGTLGTKIDHNKPHVDNANFKTIKENLQQFKSRHLKSTIIRELKKEIEQTSSPEELAVLKSKFKEQEKYKILATGQGLFMKLTGIETASIKAINAMFKEQEDYLHSQIKSGRNRLNN